MRLLFPLAPQAGRIPPLVHHWSRTPAWVGPIAWPLINCGQVLPVDA
jgi:hypothetical protein